MRAHTLSYLLLGALLTLSPPMLGNLARAAGEVEGSALPPGINPSSPAGGNGGDAQGYDKKPATPAPAGSEKKTTTPAPSTKAATAQTPEHEKPAPRKKTTVKKQ